MKIHIRGLVSFIFTLLSISLFIFIKIGGLPLFPRLTPSELREFGVFMIPLIYMWDYTIHAWPALLMAFLIAGFIAEVIPRSILSSYLSEAKMYSYILAAALAPLIAVCSCVMVPIFAGILYAGAGLGPAITFLLMAPASNILAILLTSELISWRIALARYIASFFGAIAIGMAINKLFAKSKIERLKTSRKQISIEIPPFLERCWNGLKFSGYLAKTLLPIFYLGIAIVSYVEAYIPSDIISQFMTGVKGVLLGSVIGVPMYTPTLVEVVFVKALKDLGAAPGAILAFLIGAPMTSIPSMLAVSRVVGWRVVLTYACLAILLAFITGVIYQLCIGVF